MRRTESKTLLLTSIACFLTIPAAYAADTAAPADYVASATAPVAPPSQNSLVDALMNGTPMLDMRYRYENVSQNGLTHTDGFANTVRTRLGYETGAFDDFKAKVQVETYAGLPQSTVTVGREALNLNNERWIGTADWRQLGQTMDAVTVQNHSIQDVDLFYTYGFHENRVFGPDASGASNSYDMSTHLFNADYTGIPGVKLVGYSYLLDLLNAHTLSSATTGMRVEAKRLVLENVNALFNGEYARQVSYADNPVAFGYNYYTVEPGVNIGPLTGKIAYESMGGDGNHALQAPLDTGHIFNGWAEKFLTTPAGGLDNVHASLEYKSPDYNQWLNSTVLKAVWYNFTADNNSMHYGDEYDFWVGQTFYKHYTIGLEYAQYNADKLFTDTRKLVAQLQIKY
jgi:hypothetical protein